MRNTRKINNLGEGNKLVKSYKWFNDPKVIKNFLEAIEEIVRNLPSEINILGIGSGVGNLEYATKSLLEEKYNKKVNLTLTDKSIEDIKNISGVNILNVDNKKLPFENNSFDLVIARSVTHYEKDEKDELRVLNEIKRILRNRGYFITEAPYLSNISEAQLLYKVHLLVSKPMNLKDYKKLLQLHKKVFEDISLAKKQPQEHLSVRKENFVKRYDLSGDVSDKVLELIKQYLPIQRPNVWEDNKNFGWNVNYALLICRK